MRNSLKCSILTKDVIDDNMNCGIIFVSKIVGEIKNMHIYVLKLCL